jgi:hypothetical protein
LASLEYVIADFSGGINPSTQNDKLHDNEALLAINARLDELGGIQSCPGSTLQQGSLTDGTNSNVHSLAIDASLGAIAGVGTDLYTGPTLSKLSDALAGKNTAQSKMSSSAAAESRIYFDINGVGYAFDPTLSVPVTVDWASPAAGAATTTQKTAGTGGTQTLAGGQAWSNAGNITGTSGFATVAFPSASGYSQYLKGTGFGFALSTNTLQGITVTATAKLSGMESIGYVSILATLLRNGVPVGLTQTATIFQNTPLQLSWGNSQFLWGSGLTAADLNSSTFGVIFTAQLSANANLIPVTLSIQNVQVTASQVGVGLVAGTAGSGTNLAGTYTYAVTFVAADGAESDVSGPSLPVSLGGAAGTLTSVGTGDARTTARNVYRAGGSLNSFYLIGQIADNVSTTYYDNRSDIDVLTQGTLLPGAVAGTSPNTRLGNTSVRFPCWHLERLFWANVNQPNQIIWSSVDGGPFAYPAVNELPVGDSKPCVGLVSKFGCLFIFKTDSIWVLSGTDESNFSLTRTESSVGTDQPFTIAPISNGILFCNSQGPFVFNGAVSAKFTTKLDLLFRNEPRSNLNAIETQNKSVTANYCAAANADFYYFACASRGSTSNNLLFAINLTNLTITTRSLKVLSLTVDNTSGAVYAGLANGQIVQIDDYTSQIDSQGALPWSFQTKYTDCGSRGSNLAIWSFEFYGNTGGMSVTPTIYFDGGNSKETLAPFSTTSNQRIQRRFSNSNSRKAQTVSIRLDSNVTNAQIDMTHIKIFYEVLPGQARVGQ